MKINIRNGSVVQNNFLQKALKKTHNNMTQKKYCPIHFKIVYFQFCFSITELAKHIFGAKKTILQLNFVNLWLSNVINFSPTL